MSPLALVAAPLSQAPLVAYAANFFGLVWVGFGINAILRPKEALTFFELDYPAPSSAKKQKLAVDTLSAVYGARDIFVGMAIGIASHYGNPTTLGWMMIAASSQAFIDGAICFAMVGKGQANHWGYAPILTALGLVLLGVLDK